MAMATQNNAILERVMEHTQYATDLGYVVLGTFAYGSINYGYYIDGQSDVDTKVIVLPNPRRALFDQPVSKEYHLADKSHMEVKDIREMMKMYLKGNINFVETLYTPYQHINPEFYLQFKRDFIMRRDEIARYNPHHTIASIVGQAKHTLKQFMNEDVKDPKKLHNVARLDTFLKDYINNLPYTTCLQTRDEKKRNALISLKKELPANWEELALGLTVELEKLEQYNKNVPDEPNKRLKAELEYSITTLLNSYWRVC